MTGKSDAHGTDGSWAHGTAGCWAGGMQGGKLLLGTPSGPYPLTPRSPLPSSAPYPLTPLSPLHPALTNPPCSRPLPPTAPARPGSAGPGQLGYLFDPDAAPSNPLTVAGPGWRRGPGLRRSRREAGGQRAREGEGRGDGEEGEKRWESKTDGGREDRSGGRKSRGESEVQGYGEEGVEEREEDERWKSEGMGAMEK